MALTFFVVSTLVFSIAALVAGIGCYRLFRAWWGMSDSRLLFAAITLLAGQCFIFFGVVLLLLVFGYSLGIGGMFAIALLLQASALPNLVASCLVFGVSYFRYGFFKGGMPPTRRTMELSYVRNIVAVLCMFFGFAIPVVECNLLNGWIVVSHLLNEVRVAKKISTPNNRYQPIRTAQGGNIEENSYATPGDDAQSASSLPESNAGVDPLLNLFK